MKIKVTDFSLGVREDKSDNLKSMGVAKRLLNFDCSTGALRGLKNIKRFDFDRNGVDLSGGKVFFYKKYDFNESKRADKLIFFDKNLNAYYLELNAVEEGLKPLQLKFNATPKAQNYRLDGEDVVILVSKEDNMVVWDGVKAPEIVLDAPKIGSMDIHYERLFAVVSGGDGAELKFSDDLDPTNWSESLSDAGTIELVDDRGRLLKVVSFNDYLYIFREYGITRLYANTAIQTNFYINHLFTSGGRILENTISLAGDHVFFMSTDGFYVFDGASTKKVLDNFFPKIKFTGNETATYFNGSYYLTCKLDGEKDENVIVEIRRDDLNIKIIAGLNASGVCLFSGEGEAGLIVVCEETNESYLIAESDDENSVSLPAVFSSPKLAFNKELSRKVVRSVGLYSKNPNASPVTLIIEAENGRKVELVTKQTRFFSPLFFSGDEISVSIFIQDNEVEILSLELDVREG